MADTGRAEAVALVAAGGFVGANARFLVDGVLPGLGGTLLVNAVGSLALGALLAGVSADLVATRHRLVFGTGLLASFTTYSTFAVQTVRAPGAWPLANLGATYALGFAGVLAGQALARRLNGDSS